MALTQQQINELNIASQRVASGSGTATDTANLAYATKNYGYTYTPTTTTSQPTATSLPAGMTQLTSPTQISSYNIAGQVGTTGTSGSYLYGTPKTIAADTVSSGQSLTSVGSPAPTTTNAETTAAGATQTTKSLQDYITQLTPPTTPEQTQADTLTKQISDLLGKDVGQAQSLATEEANRGIPALQNQLTGLNGQIQTGLAEYNQLKAGYDQTSVANRGQIVPMSKIIGNEAQIRYAEASALNAKASDIGLLQAQSLALQGQIEAAQTAAKKAVDLKYAPIEEQIAVKEAQLALIQPILTRQEKIQAAALQLQYDAQKEATATAKATESQLQTILLTAAAGGASQTLIDQAKATKDPIQAAQLLNVYLKDATGTASGSKTASVQEYEYYVAQEQAAGRTPVSYNAYQNLDANRKRSISTTNNVTYAEKEEDKDQNNFQSDVASYIEKLGSNTISWATAWNALRSKYPGLSNEAIDDALNKDAYYKVTGK